MKLPSITISDRAIQNFEKAFGIFGFGILIWMIYRLGPSRVATNVHMVSWGFFLMVLFKSVSYFSEAAAWKLILAERHEKVGFWSLFRTCIEGDALNYITMTHMGGEPLKAYAIRKHSSLSESAASVIVLKFCMILGFWLTIAAGFISVLLNADVTGEIKKNIGAGMLILTLFMIFFLWMQKQGMFSPLAWLLGKVSSQREWMSRQVLKLTRLDRHILETHKTRPRRVLGSSLLCALGWLEEIFFVWLVLHFLKLDEDWFAPTLIGTLSMLLNSVFFFVPFRAGTQEGTMVLTFTILDLQESTGLTIAILRRMRELVWVFIGLTMFALETLTMPPQEAAALADSGGLGNQRIKPS